jgi:putative aminopeptidase FrvX
MERYIKDNSSRVKEKAMQKLYFLVVITIMDSTKIISVGMTEFLNWMAKYTKSKLKMANSSAKLKCESCFYN